MYCCYFIGITYVVMLIGTKVVAMRPDDIFASFSSAQSSVADVR